VSLLEKVVAVLGVLVEAKRQFGKPEEREHLLLEAIIRGLVKKR
jgi:hypothetical protein